MARNPLQPRYTPEKIAEQKRRSNVVRRAAYLCGTQRALAERAEMKPGNVSRYIAGDLATPDWFLQVCEGIIQELSGNA